MVWFGSYNVCIDDLAIKKRQKAEKYKVKSKEQLKQNITLAYYTEYFARHKKLPKLEKILKDIEKPIKTNPKGDIILKAMAKEKGVNL